MAFIGYNGYSKMVYSIQIYILLGLDFMNRFRVTKNARDIMANGQI